MRWLRLGALMGCLLGFVTAHAQERATLQTVDQRLTRVENVLDQSLLKLLQRIDSLQQEVRVLSGEVESLRYELEKQQQRNRELYRDTDRRLGDVEDATQAVLAGGLNGGLGEGFDESLGLPPGTELDGSLIEGLSDEVGDEVGSDAGGAQGGALGSGDSASNSPRFVAPNQSQLQASNANDPLAPRVPVRANTTRAATQAEKEAYASAYDRLARGDSQGAIAAFDQFLREFPDGPFSDNAWYWQGEAHYANRAFQAARDNFSIVVNSFPESAKVPDARLKIGYSLYEEGDFAAARGVLTDVQNDYPGRSASVLARKRLQKMNREGN